MLLLMIIFLGIQCTDCCKQSRNNQGLCFYVLSQTNYNYVIIPSKSVHFKCSRTSKWLFFSPCRCLSLSEASIFSSHVTGVSLGKV